MRLITGNNYQATRRQALRHMNLDSLKERREKKDGPKIVTLNDMEGLQCYSYRDYSMRIIENKRKILNPCYK